MRSRSVQRCLFAAAAALASLIVPTPARAGGAVVPRVGSADPSALDVRIAVAHAPGGTTRWTEVTTPAGTSALWLVPARPGAAVDWAPDGWLAALDDATTPRILPPTAAASCPVPTSPERAPSWTKTVTKRAPATVAVHLTADAVRAYASERGYDVTPALAARITSLYDAGFHLVSIELASTWSAASSGTLRISDDGGAVLPLALTGSRTASAYVTAFALGPGAASLPGQREVDASAIRWGALGSSYDEWRRNVVEGSSGATWLREAASHAAVFEGTGFPGGIPAPSVAAAYFVNNACASSAQAAGSASGAVGITCAPGVAARVPGGTACAPSAGSIDPSAVSCGDAKDLALSLSGAPPATTFVTRWAGLVPRGALGADLPITFDTTSIERRPVVRAAAYAACDAPAPPLVPPSTSSSSSSSGGGSSSGGSSGGVYVTESGCGGSTVTTASTTYEEEEETDPPPDTTTTESCSGGTDTTSSSSDGWDDDDDDSGDSCSGDDSTSSSSSSSDSCSGGSSSSSSSGGSDDGWDTEDEASPNGKKITPAAKKPHASHKAKKKPASPVSRYAMLAVALLLPLRRRGRAQP